MTEDEPLKDTIFLIFVFEKYSKLIETYQKILQNQDLEEITSVCHVLVSVCPHVRHKLKPEIEVEDFQEPNNCKIEKWNVGNEGVIKNSIELKAYTKISLPWKIKSKICHFKSTFFFENFRSFSDLFTIFSDFVKTISNFPFNCLYIFSSTFFNIFHIFFFKNFLIFWNETQRNVTKYYKMSWNTDDVFLYKTGNIWNEI